MAINFKDARKKLADALRIQQILTDLISTEQRFITNTRASAVTTICQSAEVSLSL